MWYQGDPGPPRSTRTRTEGMVGMGQMPQLPRGMINAPGAAFTPLDTTGLENSFENLGRTMVDVLTIKQQTNLAPPRSDKKGANDTQNGADISNAWSCRHD